MATAFNPTVFQPQGTPSYAITPVAGNPAKLPDGMTQLNNLLDYQEKQALLQPKIEAGKAESKKKVLESEKAGVDLQQHYANIARSTYGGLLSDPDFVNGNKEAIKKKLDQTKEYLHSIGVPEINGGKAHNDIVSLVDKDPSQAVQLIRNGIQQAGTNAEQFAQANRAPTAIATGQGTQFVPTSQYQGAPQNQFVQGQVPVGTELVAQPNDGSGLEPGTKYLLGPQGQVQPTQQNVAPQGNQGVTPQQMGQPKPAALVSSLSPSTATNLAAGTELINKTRSAATNVPQIQFNSNQIIRLAKTADVGQGAGIVATLKGQGVFAPNMDWTGSATDFNQLGHYLAQQTVTLANNPALAGTDAGRALAAQTAGTTNWTREAIQNTSRTNRSLGELTALFNKGLSKSQQISNNNPLAANEYQNKWSNILDIDSIRLMDALKNKDQDSDGFKEIVKELGGKDSQKFIKAAKKLDEINNLVSKGQ
jgi:hypothetical protein